MNFKLIGLTGGIGMGKSTVGELLQKRGIKMIDTDVVARKLVEPGQPALAQIQKSFGASIVDAQGKLKREELARRVFADSDSRHELEAILHPRIRDAWQAEAAKWRSSGAACGVVIIPLLFETKAGSLFDSIVCVACSMQTQMQRLYERGWSASQIRQRLESQWSTEKKMTLSHTVIWTDTTPEITATQLDRIIPPAA